MNAITKDSVKQTALAYAIEVRDDITRLLPANIKPERLEAAFITALIVNPDLLNCTKKSLQIALLRAAQDRLMPDGREGAIVSYNTKVKIKEQGKPDKEEWQNTAQWMPMIQGIRKRAKELANVFIGAEVVYENDSFDYELGDRPRIDHKPTKLGEPRGRPIGAYAIFKESDTGPIIHREVMDYAEIEAVRSVSRAKDGAAWKNNWGEMARKTVARRGTKSVPNLPEDLVNIISREDELVDHEAPRDVTPARQAPTTSPLADPRKAARAALPPPDETAVVVNAEIISPTHREAELVETVRQEDEPTAQKEVRDAPQPARDDVPADVLTAKDLRTYSARLTLVTSEDALETTHVGQIKKIKDAHQVAEFSRADKGKLLRLYEAHKERLAGTKDENDVAGVLTELVK